MRSSTWFGALAVLCMPTLIACSSDATGSAPGDSNGGSAGSSSRAGGGGVLGQAGQTQANAGSSGRSSSGSGGAGQSSGGSAAMGQSGGGSAAGQSSTGAGAAGTGAAGTGAAGAGAAGAGAAGAGAGAAGAASSGPPSQAGNPDGSCSAGIPAGGKPADTSSPTVVGMGSAASCTFSALNAAVTKGGVITFNCGNAPVTIGVTATLNVPTNRNTVIDGGNKITLDGGKAVQILRFDSPDWLANENRLTLQHLTLTNGKTSPTDAIPTAQPPCSQGFNDGQGGAVYMRDGNLTVIDAIFTNNQGAPLGPDTGGGAIYVQGSKHGMLIVGSTFTNNTASNGGGVGGLFCELDIYNSVFTGNKAIGHDANNNEPDKCSAMNNGQNETGSGGNGGPIYDDGNSKNVTLCGDKITGNSAGVNGFGGGLFFTSNDLGGTLTIADTTMTGNTGGSWTKVATGAVKNVGTAVGTNAKSITVTNSTLQGYP